MKGNPGNNNNNGFWLGLFIGMIFTSCGFFLYVGPEKFLPQPMLVGDQAQGASGSAATDMLTGTAISLTEKRSPALNGNQPMTAEEQAQAQRALGQYINHPMPKEVGAQVKPLQSLRNIMSRTAGDANKALVPLITSGQQLRPLPAVYQPGGQDILILNHPNQQQGGNPPLIRHNLPGRNIQQPPEFAPPNPRQPHQQPQPQSPPKEEGDDPRKAQCRAKYGTRTYLPQDKRRLPPMLYTYPGSGNTWSRLLIEYATGILTGSVYNDGSLREALPGEFKCNYEVSVVKVHPHTHDWHGLHSGNFNSDDNKCKRGQVHHFERAIILLRDPFDSIWSEYQRRVSKSHVQGIPKRGFNWHRWQANAAALGNSYFRTWEYEHAGIERELKPEDYIYLKYEDLKDKQKRVSVLKDILLFLRYDEHASNDERIECAFILAENRQAHRSVDKSLVMTKEEAYIPEIACRMWALFGHYASKHGYKPWANYDCTGYPKIPRINVGSNGEYDRAWVSAGEKLIDFRSPETIAKHRNQTLLEHGGDENYMGSDGPFDEIRKRNKRLQRQQRRQQRPPGGPI